MTLKKVPVTHQIKEKKIGGSNYVVTSRVSDPVGGKPDPDQNPNKTQDPTLEKHPDPPGSATLALILWLQLKDGSWLFLRLYLSYF